MLLMHYMTPSEWVSEWVTEGRGTLPLATLCIWLINFFLAVRESPPNLVKVDLVYDTIQYNTLYLTISKKLTDSRLSLPHGMNKTLKYETKNKMSKFE